MPAYIREKTVHWGDCDAMGIVFYPNYFRWIDSTFHAMCAELGFSQKSLAEYGVAGTPLADVGCRFRNPVSYNETLRVEARVTRLGGSSLTMGYTFLAGDTVTAEGHEARVFVAKGENGMKSTAIPEEIRALLSRYAEPDDGPL